MGLLKSLAERVGEKSAELARRAAKRVARATLERTTSVARGALDALGDAAERAMFGDAAVPREPGPGRAAPPDPFARLKEAERIRDEAEAQSSAAIDRDLAALEKKVGR